MLVDRGNFDNSAQGLQQCRSSLARESPLHQQSAEAQTIFKAQGWILSALQVLWGNRGSRFRNRMERPRSTIRPGDYSCGDQSLDRGIRRGVDNLELGGVGLGRGWEIFVINLQEGALWFAAAPSTTTYRTVVSPCVRNLSSQRSSATSSLRRVSSAKPTGRSQGSSAAAWCAPEWGGADSSATRICRRLRNDCCPVLRGMASRSPWRSRMPSASACLLSGL